MLLDHIAIIVSSEAGIEFYKELGFEVKSIEDRGYDKLVYLSDGMTTLEAYIDPKHPRRITSPEALGLRHLGFAVENIEEFGSKWEAEVRTDKRGKFLFIYDPDGLPIEIREKKPITPEGNYE